MKNLYILVAIMAMLLGSGCTHDAGKDVLLEEGVSRELAEWRKANTESLAYEIYLRVPESKSSRIYNLQGQFLQRPSRGINIIDGRKVAVR